MGEVVDREHPAVKRGLEVLEDNVMWDDESNPILLDSLENITIEIVAAVLQEESYHGR